MSYKYIFLRILVHFPFYGYPLCVYLDGYSPELQENKRFSSEGTLKITCKKYRYPVLLPSPLWEILTHQVPGMEPDIYRFNKF